MRNLILYLLILTSSFLFISCGDSDKKDASSEVNVKNEEKKEIFEVKDNYFMAQVNDMYLNIDDYKDKIIRVEGIYANFTPEGEDEAIQMVYRNGPGCCGDDGWSGFYLEYDGKKPKEEEWILVEGIPKMVDKGDFEDLYLEVIKLEVKKERGQEFVTH